MIQVITIGALTISDCDCKSDRLRVVPMIIAVLLIRIFRLKPTETNFKGWQQNSIFFHGVTQTICNVETLFS